MKKYCNIEHIPVVIWGDRSKHVILCVHGNKSNKEDLPIEKFASLATAKGYQLVSFDLPKHGERSEEDTLCKVQVCVEELQIIYDYCKKKWDDVSLFANSMGAYFSLLALQDKPIQRAWFLSPVVNMERIIDNMMMWFGVTKERLQEEKIIETPIGETLYWDYYMYVKEHPVSCWNVPTHMLYGSKDELCERDTIENFTQTFSAELSVLEDAEHFFHTEEQLTDMERWMLQQLENLN